MEKFNVFIGFDSSRTIAYDVCEYSIHNRTDLKLEINKIGSSILSKDIWWRKRKDDSTEFSNNRFLIPYLNDYRGISIFMDDDFLCNSDIMELMKYYDDTYSVMVVKHNYTSKQKIKMDNVKQTNYNRKNWSSLMIFNNEHLDCKKLTVEYVNTCNPLDLHQFKWTDDIGELPVEYNYLVDEYNTIDANKIKFFHYTLGGPWYEEYKNCSYSDIWNYEKSCMK